ncbi:MAG: hypothetical protein C4532_17275 [Candidatus Abyssobacteria bacterium SURF_17]|uniref:Nmd3 N-terminal domain-containing protein n=1 Tax=Candidatus Abyssobacteria bacterium SURF_17 TaxID=2093361 RepID=A0A419ER23_9BACT|nr:MAG: hypothetical protein C4532_17275 [Candidatus Abyssubacteria bacterium SURF_17]
MKVCSQCYAIFDGRKWDGNRKVPKKKLAELETTLCTACKRMRDKVALGTVYLDGEVITSRADEILRMVRREEEIERARNYSSRILDIRRRGQKMTVRTVNSLLAIHIAKQFKKAFKGRIEIFKDTPGHMPRNKQSEGTVAVKWTQNP